jgi:hypothetical protein
MRFVGVSFRFAHDGFDADRLARILFSARAEGVHLDTATVAQTSKSAVSRVSKPAKLTNSTGVLAWKPAIQQVGNLRYGMALGRRIVTVSGCTRAEGAGEASQKSEPKFSCPTRMLGVFSLTL